VAVLNVGRQLTVQSCTYCALLAEQSTVLGELPAPSVGDIDRSVHDEVQKSVNQFRMMVLLAICVVCSGSSAADLFLFRGEFVYIVPCAMSDEMTRIVGRSDWKHFPEHTRYLDIDSDGERGLVVAFGATSGHGAQLRYRLQVDADGTPRLGPWYWSVVMAPDGSHLFEEFNP
jgi:hypothetical protein